MNQPGMNRMPEGMRRPSRPEYGEEMDDTHSDAGMTGEMRPKKSSMGPWILVLTIVVVLGVLGYVFRDRLMQKDDAKIGAAEFQAVFLTNGQVYFGKLSDIRDQYLTLEDIYYLQVTPVLQTKTEGEVGTQANAQQQLSLVKLGNELHGPVDKMQINRDQILFFEGLKEDGRVVQAIHDFENPK
ncbi:MAG TPA: hypothetical protein VJK50_05060 [Patescibacteria group bacterium]|nr:hypothetical protein [Patescibacteria group bacterium]